MSKAVIYARVSSMGDRQSTARQVEELRSFARKEELDIVQVFEEHASGAKEDRVQLATCIDFCKSGNAEVLLVSEISRLGRSVKIVINTLDELTKAGVAVYVKDFNLWTLMPDGTENPIAKMMLTVFALGAEMERTNIHNRLESGRRLAYERNPEKFGRPKGKKKHQNEILAKYPEVVKKLRKGLSIAETAILCNVSPTTVQKVKHLLSQKG